MNQYCLFKGTLKSGAPYEPSYGGNPHYVVNLEAPDGSVFKIVFNSASNEKGPDGDNKVYFYADQAFGDPITDQLTKLDHGLHEKEGFPRLDYFQDRSLLDIHRMRPIPYRDEDGGRADVNDDVSAALGIDLKAAPTSLPYDNGHGKVGNRDFYPAADDATVVYAFGFLFLPAKDGLHETHMNQGNPKGTHWKENGAFQDGALIIQRTAGLKALFTAFQTQLLPTDAKGFPADGAVPLPQFVRAT